MRAAGRLGLVASLVIAIAGGTSRAQTPTPVPVDEPKPRPVPVRPGSGPPTNEKAPPPTDNKGPRPVPVAPGAPPPTNEKTPYPVPLPRDPAPSPAQPTPAQPTPAQPAPAQPTQPTPAQPTPAQPTPAQPAPSQPGTPPPTSPTTTPTPTPPTPAKPTGLPLPTALPETSPIVPAKPDPMGLTTTKVSSFPQTPLVGSATIKRIVVEENSKTDADTVILISKLSTGDSWSADMAETVKADLVSSGLFKDVVVYWSNVEGGVQIHLKVKDKHSWVVAPAFYNQPTNVGGGIGFGENNLFGKNQKLLLYGQIATGDSFFIGAWVIPALGGTRFYAQLDTYLKSSRNIEYAAPTGYLDGAVPKAVRESRVNYLNGGVKLGIELFRGFKIDARFRAARVTYQDVRLADGATMADVDPTLLPDAAVPAPGGEGTDVSSEFTVSIDRRANYYGIQTGYRLAAWFERTIESASDFQYTLSGLSFYRAKKILERHNLVFRGSVNYGRDVPFQQEYSLGGTTMRGYVNSQFRGDLKVLANLEYSVPLLTIKGFSVRGLAFLDTGYATFVDPDPIAARRHYLPGSAARGADPFKNSVGIGTRLYLRQIVLPLLGLDFGYGLEARDAQIYLAIGLTD